MNPDGRDSDDADWLLAQLASGRTPPRRDPPVVPPPAVTPPAAARPLAPAEPPSPPPRREEVLDWFSLAEPEAPSDAATRALPVIGGPSVREPAAPPAAAAPPVPPVAPPVVPPAAPTGLPAWNPPFTVGRPGPIPHVSHPNSMPIPVVSVEPPVGSVPPAADVPPVAPVLPAAPVFPAAPVPPAFAGPPPGPVTPTAPFALTWGSGDLDSEDAIRAAFRSLSGSAYSAPDRAPDAASDAREATASHTPPPAVTPPGASAPVPEPEPAPSPFAEYTPPPVARQSFTPVTNPTPTPPRHPIAPTTAPAGWDERSARPAPRKDFDDELWSALTDDAQPAPSPAPQRTPAGSPAAPVPPGVSVPPAVSEPPAAPVPPAMPVPPVATPSTPAPSRPTESNGFPFIEVRGEADSAPSPFGGPAAESAANRRVPFPAFAASGGDDRPRQPDPEPVDDLLAALGAGTARPGRDDGRDADTPAGRGGGSDGTPPERGGTPPIGPEDDPLDALGLAFGDDDDDEADDTADELGGLPSARIAPPGGGRDTGGEPEPVSPIAREIAATGYFWNLTPDPSAPDPKAEPAAESEAPMVPSPFGRPSPYGAEDGFSLAEAEQVPEADLEPEPVPEPEPEPEPETSWSFGGDELTAIFPPATAHVEPVAPIAAPPTAGSTDDDPLASLFGAASAQPAAAPGWPPAAPLATGGAFGAAAASAPPGTRAPSAPQTVGTGGGPGRGAPTGRGGASGGSGGNRTLRTLLWITGGLVVAVVIAGLFFLGTLLPFGGGDAGAPSAQPSATETPVAEPTGPQPVGVHAWNTLFGGECIDPFVSVWEEEFTVVDCAAPHAAQLVYRGELAGDAAAPFPGEAEIAAQMNALCTASGVIDVGLVAGMPDLQVQAAFPVTEEQWASGERTYYCFANRASGEPLTGSIAGPGPAA